LGDEGERRKKREIGLERNQQEPPKGAEKKRTPTASKKRTAKFRITWEGRPILNPDRKKK